MRSEISSVLLAAIAASAGCAELDAESSATVEAATVTGAPLAGISAQAFAAARDAFTQDETITGGLGPLFNATACGRCHTLGGIGGAGVQINRHFGAFINGVFDPLGGEGGDARSLFSLGTFQNGTRSCTVPVETEPADATVHNIGRLTPPLFGLGLIDAMPDAFFDALAAAEPLEIRGTVKRQGILLPNPADRSQAIGTPRVARFGWKDALTNLAEFSAAAYNGEMGITTQSCINGAPFLIFAGEAAPNGRPVPAGCDDLAPPPPPGVPPGVDEAVGSCDGGKTELAEDVQLFLDFMTFLGPPTRDFSDAISVARGAPIFTRIGCAGCHVTTTFVTPNPSPNGVPGGFAFQPFSDFLAHDMGGLGDTIGNAGDSVIAARRMRTAPLWGIRFRNALLHDGRAGNVDAAIRAHDGQGARAAAAYRRLGGSDQHNVVQFVRSL
ncbi:MAG TPA: di-heme oxidoredictase family protein [Kofleriaceae bacterium]